MVNRQWSGGSHQSLALLGAFWFVMTDFGPLVQMFRRMWTPLEPILYTEMILGPPHDEHFWNSLCGPYYFAVQHVPLLDF